MKFLGPNAVAAYLENIPNSSLNLIEPEQRDYLRAAQLIRQYRDAPLDYVDALIVASAERLNVTTILTLERRHFHMVRPLHCPTFEILP
jgi:predicted nucleic acid-binding protein